MASATDDVRAWLKSRSETPYYSKTDEFEHHQFLDEIPQTMIADVTIKMSDRGIKLISIRKHPQDSSIQGTSDNFNEYSLIASKIIGRKPDVKRRQKISWGLPWGVLSVEMSAQAEEAAIFMSGR